MRQKILETGLKIWRTDPFGVTARNIARRMGVSHSGVLYYFNGDLKDCIAFYAVERKDAKVIAQLIATGHPAVAGMSKRERMRYINAIHD
jgi:AcrR family transcriptional regulator